MLKKFVMIAAVIFSLAAIFCSERAYADTELFQIRVPMEEGAAVTATDPSGKETDIGRVLMLPTTTRWPSYTASAWGKPGEICASAVNAIHMLVGVEKERGRTMSIIPKETIAPAAGAGAAVVISTKAGTGIFGAWAPPVSSPVYVIKKGQTEERLLSKDNLPVRGDTLLIRAVRKDMPYMVEIENRPGGRVTEWYSRGCRVIGRVIRPVSGTGRFGGTMFQSVGELRANHPGVIDFSTSPRGIIGGFQIIPWDHALTSKEMQNVWYMTQWMILAPADGKSKMGGTFPLFSSALVPGTADGERLWDIWSTYGRRSPMLMRMSGGAWQKTPDVSGKNDNGLKALTHIRIYYPLTDEPLKEK